MEFQTILLIVVTVLFVISRIRSLSKINALKDNVTALSHDFRNAIAQYNKVNAENNALKAELAEYRKAAEDTSKPKPKPRGRGRKPKANK